MNIIYWKRAVKERDGNACRFCKSSERLEAHHIRQIKDRPDLALAIDNGITLCHECHLGAHVGRFNPRSSSLYDKYSHEYCKPVIDFVKSFLNEKDGGN